MKKLLLILCLCAGCGIQDGKIVDKYWVKAHYETINQPMMMGKIIIPNYTTVWVEDKYYVIIQKRDKSNDICIYKSEWDIDTIGQYVSYK